MPTGCPLQHCRNARNQREAPTHRNKVDLWLLRTEPIRNCSVMDTVDLLIYGRLVCRRILKYVGVSAHCKKKKVIWYLYTTDLCPPIYSKSFLDNLIHKPYGSYVNTILLYWSENNDKKEAGWPWERRTYWYGGPTTVSVLQDEKFWRLDCKTM